MGMMALGQFVFGLDNLTYRDLQRSNEWRHPTNSRVGARPAGQYVGPGEDSITLSGVQIPEFRGKRLALDELRTMADAGSAYALVGGNGEIFGAWTIRRLQETGTYHTSEGIARKVEFTLELGRADSDQVDPAGGASDGTNPGVDNDSFWDWWLS